MSYPPMRKHGNRSPKNVILIVTEGKTENQYFRSLKKRGCNIEFKMPTCRPTDALNIVELCEKKIDELGINVDEGDLAVCVFDVMGNDDNNLQISLEKAKTAGILLALSNPCFELWFLIHYREVTHKMNCEEILDLLRVHIKDYKKGKYYGNQLDVGKAKAIYRAEKLEVAGDMSYDYCLRTNPSVTIHRVLETVDSMINGNK